MNLSLHGICAQAIASTMFAFWKYEKHPQKSSPCLLLILSLTMLLRSNSSLVWGECEGCCLTWYNQQINILLFLILDTVRNWPMADFDPPKLPLLFIYFFLKDGEDVARLPTTWATGEVAVAGQSGERPLDPNTRAILWGMAMRHVRASERARDYVADISHRVRCWAMYHRPLALSGSPVPPAWGERHTASQRIKRPTTLKFVRWDQSCRFACLN